MFLNNHSSTRSILTNNENATGFHRSKSIGENGSKKTTFNENNVTKTPHRNKDAASSSKGGQNTQRRRRALGDISNRKGGGSAAGGGSGKGGVILKQALKSANSTSFPSSSTKNRTAQVKFSKTPSTKSAANKARLGGSGVKSANSKPKQSSAEYDGVFGVTTRWASEDLTDDTRSPLDLIPKEEMDMLSDFTEEMHARQKKKNDERVRLEMERCEKQFVERMNDIDIEGFDEKALCGDEEATTTDEWDLLDQKLPWEEEDGDYDPAEERRLSGSDPFSLWGDI